MIRPRGVESLPQPERAIISEPAGVGLGCRRPSATLHKGDQEIVWLLRWPPLLHRRVNPVNDTELIVSPLSITAGRPDSTP